MQTRILLPDQEGIQEASRLLQSGELVAFPTETVYGLGASVFLPEAISKIFHVKRRPQDNPLIAHIAEIEELSLLAAEIPKSFYCLSEHFFPGPLTLVVEKRADVPSIVSAGGPHIAIRMPSHDIARALIRAAGSPLVAPSANLSGKPSSTRADHVLNDFDGQIAAVIDGGACSIGIESTVLSLIGEPMLLRLGTITKEAIEAVLGTQIQVANAFSEKPLSPGMKYRHYAPLAKVRLFESEEGARSYSESSQKRCKILHPTALELYSDFRAADKEGIEELLVICSLEVKRDLALMNRLEKASQ